MSNIESIEQAVQALPPEQLAEIRRWFAEFDADAWDRQVERDALAGKLEALVDEARADHASGANRSL